VCAETALFKLGRRMEKNRFPRADLQVNGAEIGVFGVVGKGSVALASCSGLSSG
jgi:hypothetical protein